MVYNKTVHDILIVIASTLVIAAMLSQCGQISVDTVYFG